MKKSHNQVLVLVAQHFRFPHEAGGLRPFRIARALAKSGFTVHVLAAAGKYAAEECSVQTGDSWSFTVERLKIPYSQEMGEASRIWSFLRFAIASTLRVLKIRPDLVYATSTPLLVGIPAVVSKAVAGSRMIFEVRDLWPEVPMALGFLRNPLLRLVARRLEIYFYRFADSILVLSPGMFDHVTRSLRTKKPVHLIPNVSDFEFFEQGMKQELDKVGGAFAQLSHFIIYAGSFGQANGTNYLPLMAKELLEKGTDLSVLAVGQGSSFQETRVLAQQLGVLGVNYHQFNHIPANLVPALYARADAMISVFADNPSLILNSANKFFDGLAAGLPIVINYGGWQSELIEEHCLGLVLGNPLSQQDLQKLSGFLTNRKALDRAGGAAVEIGRAFFSLEKFEGHLLMAVPLNQESSQVRNQEKSAEVCFHPTCREFLEPRSGTVSVATGEEI